MGGPDEAEPTESEVDQPPFEDEMFGIFMRDAEGTVWMFTPRPRIIPEDGP